MALLSHPLLFHLSLKNPLHFSTKPTSTIPPISLSCTPRSSRAFSPSIRGKPSKRELKEWSATAEVSAETKGYEGEEDEKVLVPVEEEGEKRERVVAKYDWREEWYPLYLTDQVPDDAPLGLTVFDKQIVLYRDGNGVLQCYEDRCPHR